MKRIYVGSPVQDLVHAIFHVSVVRMMQHLYSDQPTGVEAVQIGSYGATLVPYSRQMLVHQAIEADATHVVMIDSDMEFPPDLVHRLSAHEVPIVAANCLTRRPPFRATAQRDSQEVPTTVKSTGLEEVHRVGTAVLMVAMDVFLSIPQPWFPIPWIPEYAVFRGEDYAFCDAARAAGFPIYIDHDLSKAIFHHGSIGWNPLQKSIAQARVDAAVAAAKVEEEPAA